MKDLYEILNENSVGLIFYIINLNLIVYLIFNNDILKNVKNTKAFLMNSKTGEFVFGNYSSDSIDTGKFVSSLYTSDDFYKYKIFVIIKIVFLWTMLLLAFITFSIHIYLLIIKIVNISNLYILHPLSITVLCLYLEIYLNKPKKNNEIKITVLELNEFDNFKLLKLSHNSSIILFSSISDFTKHIPDFSLKIAKVTLKEVHDIIISFTIMITGTMVQIPLSSYLSNNLIYFNKSLNIPSVLYICTILIVIYVFLIIYFIYIAKMNKNKEVIKEIIGMHC